MRLDLTRRDAKPSITPSEPGRINSILNIPRRWARFNIESNLVEGRQDEALPAPGEIVVETHPYLTGTSLESVHALRL